MRIALLGDIALFGVNTVQKCDYKKKFAVVKQVLDSCDYVVGNLETPITDSQKVVGGKSAYIKTTKENIDIIRYLGVSHVSLSNNHVYDYCEKGLLDTINCLDKNNIKWFGVNDKVQIIDDGDNHVQLFGYCCYSTNGKGLGEKSNYVNVLDPKKVETDIVLSIEKGFLPILSIHWGQEHVHYPNIDHVKLARKLSEVGSFVVHGHHPHVIQGIEKVRDSLIAYSLGNFCFDDVYTSKSEKPLIKLSPANRESFVLVLNVSGNKVTDFKIVPFAFTDDSYVIDGRINDKIAEWSESLNMDENEYVLMRRNQLNAYIQGRKKLRDFQWYLKRLNFESVRMICSAHKNAEHYCELISSYIK